MHRRWPLPFNKNIFRLLVLGTVIPFSSCGSGGVVSLDIVLASNATQNPLIKISQDMSVGLSAGVFFKLDELKTAPVSINDLATNGNTYSEPDLNGGVGDDPLTDEFKVSTSSLNPTSFYRIQMMARNSTGTTTHIGVGDCPIKVSLKDANRVKICFGKNDSSNPPLCPGLTAFSLCPGL
jgi:hypothetical protein